MKKKDYQKANADFFRQKAEELLKLKPADPGPAMQGEEPMNLFHAMREYQAELESLNHELLAAAEQAEQKINETEQLGNSLFEINTGLAYCRMLYHNAEPVDFIYLRVNHAFETQTGLKEVQGKKATQLISGIKETSPELFEICGRVAGTGQPEKFETYIESLGMWFELSVNSPAPEYFVAVFNVITERKQLEIISSARLELLKFAENHSFDDLLEETLNQAEKLTGSLIGFYHFVDPDQKTLRLQNWSTRTKSEFCRAEAKGMQYDVSLAGVWAGCLRERKAVIHNDYSSLPDKKGLPPGHAPVEREMVVPVIRLGKVVAMLGVGNKPVDYTNKDLESVSMLADLCWDIASRKQAEEKTYLSNARLQRMINSEIVGIAIASADGSIIDTNDFYLSLLGYTREDFETGQVNWRNSTPAEWRSADEKAIAELWEKGTCAPYEKEYFRRDGSRVNVLVTDSILPGSEKQIFAVVLDITDRKRAEEALISSGEFNENLLNSMQDGLSVLDKDGVHLNVNSALCLMTGYSRTELIGAGAPHPYWPEEEYERINSAFRDTLETGSGNFELIFKRKNGGRFPVIVSPFAINDKAGKLISYSATVKDISELKNIEFSLRESEYKYRELVENSPDAIAIYSEGRIVFVNRQCAALMGAKSADELIGKPVFGFVHPDYRALVARRMKEAGEKKKVLPFTGEKFIRLDGSAVDVEVSAIPITLGNEPAVQLIVRDITERKKAEEALTESREKYQQLADLLPQVVFEVDLNGKLTYVNKKAFEIFGYATDESIREINIIDFFPIEDQERVYRNLKESIADWKVSASNEYCMLRKDGTTFSALVYSSPITKDGKTTGLRGIIVDVSELKLVEEALKRNQAALNRQNELFSKLLENLQTGIFMAEVPSGRPLVANEAASKLLGRGILPDVSLSNLSEVYMAFKSGTHEPYPPEEMPVTLGMKGISASVDDLLVVRPDGSEVLLEIYGTPVTDSQGNIWASLVSFMDITERKRIENALRESRERYRELIELAVDGILILSDEAVITEANSCICQLAGRNREDIIGVNLRNFFFTPESIEKQPFDFKRLNEGFDVVKERSILRPDGSVIDVEMRTKMMPDGSLQSIFRDITERKLSQLELKKSEQKYRELFEANTDGITIFYVYPDNTLSKIVDLNTNAAEMLGYSRDEMLWKSPHELEKDITGEAVLKRQNDLLTKGFSVFETILFHKDGHEIPVEIKVLLVNYNDRPALMNIVRDITDRKSSELKLQQYAAELKKQIAEKDKFFSIIAHDLRSPFNAFLGFTDLMVKDLPGMSMEEISQIALSMKKSAGNLFNLLENLLQWSLLQRGQSAFNPVPLYLLKLVEPCVDQLRDAADHKNIVIRHEIQPGIILRADEKMLESLLRNLVTNAVKFTPRGGHVAISAKIVDAMQVLIAVSDNGIGMSKLMIDKLFRLDAEVNRRGTEGEPSSGLGLIICRDLVEKQGGTIWAESEEGAGSTFYFTLPAVR